MRAAISSFTVHHIWYYVAQAAQILHLFVLVDR